MSIYRNSPSDLTRQDLEESSGVICQRDFQLFELHMLLETYSGSSLGISHPWFVIVRSNQGGLIADLGRHVEINQQIYFLDVEAKILYEAYLGSF